MSHILAIDIGGTKTAGAIATADGEILQRATRPTPRGTPDDIGKTLEGIFAALTSEGTETSDFHSVVIGVPEYVDPQGVVVSSEVVSWTAQPAEYLRPLLPGRAQSFLTVSDVRAGAMGEAYFGAGADLKSFFYVSLGTGLSSTMVLHDTPWSGAAGKAIALGEFSALGSRDFNLEQFASGTGLEKRFEAATGIFKTGRELDALAARGDSAARDVVDTAADALADALMSVACLLDPGTLIIGGGLGTSSGYFMSRVRDQYSALMQHRAVSAPIMPAQTGSDSALLGCIAYGACAPTHRSAAILRST